MAKLKDSYKASVGGATEARKREHIETVLNANVAAKGVTTGFEMFAFEHCALPDVDLDNIYLSTTVFGRELRAPILISSLTGGAGEGGVINRRLAECAQELGLGMGVGSQWAAIEQAELAHMYQGP
jgi:isopentenyl-diphosphate delta-isomerase